MQRLTIGKLAKANGIGAGTLRYYEQLGLLAAVPRSPALGFSLDEVAELLALSDNPRAGARAVKKATQTKIADIERRIDALRRVKRGLEALASRCSGHGTTGECPILAALNRDEQ
jgi:MerR family copper efflux transcriptional regulator